MNNLTEELASFIVDTRWEDLPESSVYNVKSLILDSIGCALAGLSVAQGKMAVTLAKQLGGPPESSIIGTDARVSCSNAAFANGELIRALDFDAMPPGGHTPPYILPPALAVAESRGSSCKDFLLSTMLGFETAARVARGLQGGGFSFSSTNVNSFKVGERGGAAYANFGAAAGVGKIIGLDRNKMTNALGLAGHLCQVLTNTKWTYSARRHMAKYGVAGWQNTGGVMAALLAEMGYMGDTTVFDEYGFADFCGYGGWKPERVTEGLGKTWFCNNARYKPYPTCGMVHTALDCFYSIINQNNLSPDDIESVMVYDHPVLQSPIFVNREITNITDVQFGPHYAIALAAHKIPIGVEWQDLEIVNSPGIVEFAKRVSFKVHPDYAKWDLKDPSSHLSKVEVISKGRTFSEERIYSRGTPIEGFALTEGEIIDKFEHNASRILPSARIKRATKTILEMDKSDSMARVIKQITL